MTKPLNHGIGPLLRLSALLAGILAFEIMYGPFMPEAPSASSTRVEKPVVSLNDTPLEKPRDLDICRDCGATTFHSIAQASA